MKNKLWILVIGFIILAAVVGIYVFSDNKNDNNGYTASKSSTNNTEEANNNIDTNSNTNISNENKLHITINETEKTGELVSTFSTKIYTPDNNRQNNITITCNTLNNTIVPSGSTFSFCDTVGKATSDRGYLEADVFDKNGNKVKGIGGGNCQVSTTLYNAVLQLPQLAVIERHAHSNKVPYIETGKDAAVSYGSYDLKFRNDYPFNIKIEAVNNPDSIVISLYKIV